MADDKSLSRENESNSERFESDSKKIVRKHLADKEHVISDEEMRNVRIGMMNAQNEEQHSDSVEPLLKKQGLENSSEN